MKVISEYRNMTAAEIANKIYPAPKGKVQLKAVALEQGIKNAIADTVTPVQQELIDAIALLDDIIYEGIVNPDLLDRYKELKKSAKKYCE